jgi:hypothetical protein
VATKSVETFVMTTMTMTFERMFCALACVWCRDFFFFFFRSTKLSRFFFLSRSFFPTKRWHTSPAALFLFFFLFSFSSSSSFSSLCRPYYARNSSRWSRRNRRKQTVNQRAHVFQFPRRVRLLVPMQTSLRGNDDENVNIDDGDCSPRRRRRRDGGVLVGGKVAGAVRNR